MEEENEKLRSQIKTDFIGQCKNIEDEISLNKEKIHSFLQSIKDEIGMYEKSF
jgi:ribosomal protein S20